MKKLLLCMIIACFGISYASAQDIYDDYKTPAKQEKLTKEEKKARKEKEKHLQAFNDSVAFKFANAALREGQFVLLATRVELGNMGAMEYGLNDHTNFVYQVGKEAVIQIAFNGPNPGFNGMGGITCRGNVTNSKYSVDKKGNAHYDFSVFGSDISAQVMITVYAETNQAIAYVEPTFAGSNMSITLHGELRPYKKE